MIPPPLPPPTLTWHSRGWTRPDLGWTLFHVAGPLLAGGLAAYQAETEIGGTAVTVLAFVMLYVVTLGVGEAVRLHVSTSSIVLEPGRLDIQTSGSRITLRPEEVRWIEPAEGRAIQFQRGGGAAPIVVAGFDASQAADMRSALGMGEFPAPAPREAPSAIDVLPTAPVANSRAEELFKLTWGFDLSASPGTPRPEGEVLGMDYAKERGVYLAAQVAGGVVLVLSGFVVLYALLFIGPGTLCYAGVASAFLGLCALFVFNDPRPQQVILYPSFLWLDYGSEILVIDSILLTEVRRVTRGFEFVGEDGSQVVPGLAPEFVALACRTFRLPEPTAGR